MSKTHTCDRCGKEFEDGDGKATCDWAVCVECIAADARYDKRIVSFGGQYGCRVKKDANGAILIEDDDADEIDDDAVMLDADRPDVRE